MLTSLVPKPPRGNWQNWYINWYMSPHKLVTRDNPIAAKVPSLFNYINPYAHGRHKAGLEALISHNVLHSVGTNRPVVILVCMWMKEVSRWFWWATTSRRQACVTQCTLFYYLTPVNKWWNNFNWQIYLCVKYDIQTYFSVAGQHWHGGCCLRLPCLPYKYLPL